MAALGGASVWVSLGVLAVTGERGVRLGMLPALWVLLVCLVFAVVIAVLIRLQTPDSWPLVLTTLLWLPWLPWRVPAAVLALEGPIEIGIWCGVGGGLVIAALSRRSRLQHWPTPRLAPWMLATVTLACSVGGLVALRQQLPGGDEPHYLIITESVIADGDLQIENNHNRGDYLAYHANAIRPDFLRRGANGEIYSIHAPGVSMLVLPIFALAGYHGAAVFIAGLCAIAVGLLWRAALALTNCRGAAWAAILAIAFSVPFFFHTFVIFPDPVGAVVVAVVMFVLVKLDIAPSLVSRWHLAGCGWLLGLLPWLHTRFALIAVSASACLMLRLCQRADRWRNLAAFVGGPIISAAAWFSYFWMIYGTINPAAPYGGSRQNSLAWMPNGVTGLLLDQQFGLASNAPVMILVPLGLFLMWPARRRLVIETLTIGLPYFATVSSFGMWWGGWSAPARFLVPVMPLAIPALAYAWREGGPTIRSSFVALVALGGANTLARTVAGSGHLLYNIRDGSDVLLDWLSRSVNLPFAMPAVHRQPIELAVTLGVIWVVIATAALLALLMLIRLRPGGVGARWALTCTIGTVAAATAVSASWHATGTSPLTPQSSKMDFLQRWNPDSQSLALTLPSLRRLSSDETLDAIHLHTSERLHDGVKNGSLLALSRVPAGNYRLIIEGASSLGGHLTVSVGATLQTIDSWSLDGVSAGASDFVISLPVQVHSLTIRGDALARARISDLWLKPTSVVGAAARIPGLAVRASRYRAARSFFLDDGIYMEPGGMWTGGNSSSKLVLTTDDETGTVDVDLHAGPVKAAVAVNAGDWSTQVELTAGQHRRLSLPTNVVISIETQGAFRPIEHEPVTNDRRQLGVRIEFP